MPKLCVVTDMPSKEAAIRRQLDGVFDFQCVDFDQIGGNEPAQDLLLDVDLSRDDSARKVKDWLSRRPKDARVIIAIDKTSHLQSIRATALGANGILHRPFAGTAVVEMLLGGADLASSAASGPVDTAPGTGDAVGALRNIFGSACHGTPLDLTAVSGAGEAVVRRMEADGLESWLETVRRHHSQTYQHCLIVTGVTAAFAQHLGFSRPDQQRMLLGALLHDIGKARMPLAILEKPASLTRDEMAVMSKHPEYGLEALKASPAVNREQLDIVMHHHEYLDGSGYPHGLRGGEISDPVRIVTICDVFGALVERRAYRPPLPAARAYQILLDMGDKLDRHLVREFSFTKSLRSDVTA